MHAVATGAIGGSMLSIAGLTRDTVEALCIQAREAEGSNGVAQIANSLWPHGFTCAGTCIAMEKLHLLASGTAGVLQVRAIPTGGAFHTNLMEKARSRLEAALANVLPRMHPTKYDLYLNVTGSILPAGAEPKEICELLLRQLTHEVLWGEAM